MWWGGPCSVLDPKRGARSRRSLLPGILDTGDVRLIRDTLNAPGLRDERNVSLVASRTSPTIRLRVSVAPAAEQHVADGQGAGYYYEHPERREDMSGTSWATSDGVTTPPNR